MNLPPIIDEGTFALAQQIKTKRTVEGTSENGNNEAMLLTGILRCGGCGAQLVSTATHKKTASGVRKYRLAQLRKELTVVEARLQRYYEAVEQGAMSPGDVGVRLTELNQQKKLVVSKILRHSTVQELPAHLANPAHIGKVRDALAQILREGEHRTKRRYLSLLLESIAVQGEEVTLNARNDAVLAMLKHGENLQDKPGEELCLGVRNGSPYVTQHITRPAPFNHLLTHFPTRPYASHRSSFQLGARTHRQ